MDARVWWSTTTMRSARSSARTLRRRGCSVEEAADGIQGLACVEKAAPDVVVTDMAMPRLDGLGFLTGARRSMRSFP